jgi:hypothetical protein
MVFGSICRPLVFTRIVRSCQKLLLNGVADLHYILADPDPALISMRIRIHARTEVRQSMRKIY